MPSKKSESKRPVVRRTSPPSCSALDGFLLVTGYGKSEWHWKSTTCSVAVHGGKIYDEHDGGCDLYEVLTRGKPFGHKLLRVKKPNPTADRRASQEDKESK